MDGGLFDATEWYKLGDSESCPINILDPTDAFHNYCDEKPYHKLEAIGFVDIEIQDQPDCLLDEDQK